MVVTLLYTITQGINTLARLDVVERQRDQWQRPSEIIQALNLKPGAVVVDLGCGAGYFALKLPSVVGNSGMVLAVDLRKMSLAFLWIRALLRNQRNVTIVHGAPEDPHMPGAVDAVLVVNTYHELSSPKTILDQIRRSVVSDGRLVVADRGPEAVATQSRNGKAQRHGLALALVEEEVRRAGFEIIRREDHFLDQPGEGSWWLLVARKQ